MSTPDADAQQSQPRRSRRRLWLALAVLLLVPFFSLGLGRAVGGRTVADSPLVAAAAAVRDNFFEPASLEIPAGATVVWTWEGRAPHNIIGKELEAPVQTSGTFSYLFAAPGVYDYVCTLHRGMHGRITVTAAPD